MWSQDRGSLCREELQQGTLGVIHRDRGGFEREGSRWEDCTDMDPSLSSDDHPIKTLDMPHYHLVICDTAWYDFPCDGGIDIL